MLVFVGLLCRTRACSGRAEAAAALPPGLASVPINSARGRAAGAPDHQGALPWRRGRRERARTLAARAQASAPPWPAAQEAGARHWMPCGPSRLGRQPRRRPRCRIDLSGLQLRRVPSRRRPSLCPAPLGSLTGWRRPPAPGFPRVAGLAQRPARHVLQWGAALTAALLLALQRRVLRCCLAPTQAPMPRRTLRSPACGLIRLACPPR